MPALVLGIGTGAYYARLAALNLVTVLGLDYIRARGRRGVSRVRVVAVQCAPYRQLAARTMIGLDLRTAQRGRAH